MVLSNQKNSKEKTWKGLQTKAISPAEKTGGETSKNDRKAQKRTE